MDCFDLKRSSADGHRSAIEREQEVQGNAWRLPIIDRRWRINDLWLAILAISLLPVPAVAMDGLLMVHLVVMMPIVVIAVIIGEGR